jgi:predicted ester cyclase
MEVVSQPRVADEDGSDREWLMGIQDAIFNGRDLDAFDRYFAPDFVRHAEDRDYSRGEYREVLAALHDGFADLDTSFTEVTVELPRVAFRWTGRGTHTGYYFGVPPTQREVTATGLTITRIADGQIVEEWASWNKLSLLHALGILPISPT